eukprot:PhF_6_TR24783/c0_g1_i1/m.34056/K00624/E2.3.1.7; carnitine O-acetyltransferase
MYWDEDYTFGDEAVKTPTTAYVHPSEARSAYGWTDLFSLNAGESQSTLASHQGAIPRLPIPTLDETCALYLDSLVGVCTAEEYHNSRRAVDAFLVHGGIGDRLQALLKKREEDMVAQKSSPSWLEPWWDDAYLCGRDPIPINVNYCYGLEAHPQGGPYMGQAWRSAALVYSAVTIALEIRSGSFPLDYEKTPSGAKAPLDMSQMARVFGASRIPADPRDYIVTYTTNVPPPADAQSQTSRFVAEDPKHIVVLCRNRYFKVNVIEEDNKTPVPVQNVLEAMQFILADCDKEGAKGGPPVGIFTTQDRTLWAQYREELITAHNEYTLSSIQSALFLVVLDSVKDISLDEHARVCLHGSGTNRWFDKHQMIVTRDGHVGFCFEHSVGDGTTTLTVVDEMFKRHKSVPLCTSASTKAPKLLKELTWKLTGSLDIAMRDSFESFRKLVMSTHTRVLNFTQYGGNFIKQAKLSPDAFVQVAFQLTYYKMYGRNDATYESASTRSFLHGRTETVRSVTSVVSDFCHSVTTQPLFPPHARTTLPRPIALLRSAVDAHVNYMKRAKQGKGVDRHMLGLRMTCLENGIDLPPIFTDPSFAKSSRWRLSTSHCGSANLKLFGFGPVVPDGYGLGYMIKNDSISVTVTSNSTHPQGSSVLFVRMLESTLLHLSALIDAEKIVTENEKNDFDHDFMHPTASMTEFDFEPGVGFRYRVNRDRGGLYNRNLNNSVTNTSFA